MFDYSDLYRHMTGTPLESWLASLPADVETALTPEQHGSLPQWRALLEAMPPIRAGHVDLDADWVDVGRTEEIDDTLRERIRGLLQGLHPWRKGPFRLFGIHIDTEWRSDRKWNRLAPHIRPLAGRRVLDVGCGNGYYAWRMLGAGAAEVIGLDPTLLYVMQYWAIRRFLGPRPAWVLPLAMERLPPRLGAFDTVFSMGVLYHRREPQEHLEALREALRPGGELVLETLVLDEPGRRVLVPPGRYAKMRNVWALATCALVEAWIEKAGFAEVRCVDVTRTTVQEQRSTPWMTFQSLPDFLDPDDPARTVEGLPAPVRALFVAIRP